jgi:hypothetical protein
MIINNENIITNNTTTTNANMNADMTANMNADVNVNTTEETAPAAEAKSKKRDANIVERLCVIQTNLKVMKGNYNSYSKYEYRSLEDILAAVKPLLSKTRTVLTFTEELIPVGTNLFMKCTATLMDPNGERISTSTIIRVDSHKGMCAEQAFGAAISYARKYVAGALLLVDGAKDFDTNEVTQATGQAPIPSGNGMNNGYRKR